MCVNHVKKGNTYSALINRVYKCNKSSCQIALSDRHPRYICHDKRLIASHQLKIIRRTRGAAYQLTERKSRCLPARLRYDYITAPDLVHRPMRSFVFEVAQVLKPLVCVANGMESQWVMVHARWWTGNLAVVGRGIEI